MEDRPLIDFRQSQAARIVTWGRALLLMIIIMFAGLMVRVVQLKLAPSAKLLPAVGTSMSTRLELTRRGDLLDCKGRVVATSTVGHRLFIDPAIVADRETIAVEVGRLILADPAIIDRKLADRPESRYVVINDDLQDWQMDAIKKANLRGVGLQSKLVRHYPHVDMAAGMVGKVGFEHTGLAGFERIFDKELTPTPGKLTYLRDVRRQALWIDPKQYEPGRNGQDVRLSIDLVVQEIAEKRLRRAVDEYNAGGGRMVVMDTVTGEVLAMADFINARRGWTEQIEDALRRIHPALGRNRCVSDPYEPGSTFKPFVWSVATEMGKATLDEKLPTPHGGGWRTPYGRVIRDVHYYGPMTWRMVLVKSMNSGMAMIAERLTHAQMQQIVRRFGFGSRTSCGIPGETAGIVTSPRKWRSYTQSSVAMGHEVAVTPLQMVRAFSVFCRDDGTMITPRITAVDRSRAAEPVVEQPNPSPPAPQSSLSQFGIRQTEPSHSQERFEVFRQVLRPETVAITRQTMKGVMEEGTGRAATSDKYQIFGKSGTAQLPRKDRKGYHQDRYVASFIGGAPYAQPRIVVLCVIDDPDKSRGHFGGAIAGPVVRDVIDQTLTYMGIAPDVDAAGNVTLTASR